MAASTADRNTERRSGEELALPVAAATKIYAGIMVALNAAGYLVAAADTAGLKVIGRSEQQVDNLGGANGALLCHVRRGVYLFDNSTTNALDADDLFEDCFVEDDHTVAETSTNGVKAGRFVGFGGDPSGSDVTQCWVEIFSYPLPKITTADATDLASAVALANAIKAALNAG
jgi:hypothetical protein